MKKIWKKKTEYLFFKKNTYELVSQFHDGKLRKRKEKTFILMRFCLKRLPNSTNIKNLLLKLCESILQIRCSQHVPFLKNVSFLALLSTHSPIFGDSFTHTFDKKVSVGIFLASTLASFYSRNFFSVKSFSEWWIRSYY